MVHRGVHAVALALAALVLLRVALPVASAAKHGNPDVPPPTPVPVSGGGTSPSPFPTVLRTPPPSATVPQLAAGAAVLEDLDTGQVLFSSNGDDQRPIASLTKLMTAVLVLRRAELDDVVTVSEAASTDVGGVGISELGLESGERISVRQLLYALLLQSANDAAVALAEDVSGSVERFVKAMNAQARRLGLRHTRFFSPNGLDDRGYSTALDLARLARVAFAMPDFERVATTKFHEIRAPSGPPREIQNRNVLLWLYKGALGGKTGYTSAAGFCVVAAAQREGMRLVAVVLGDPGEPFSAAASLLDYGFAAFSREHLVDAGQTFEPVVVQGRRVGVATSRAVEALVRSDAKIRFAVVPRPDVTFPPGLGESVATLRVEAGATVLRRIPLLATRVPPPPEPSEPGPWWRRAGSAVAGAVSSLVSGLFG
ncbi:MAG: D-alanyl-D-alanine carboxypeptidase family protein [Actinomycetota bacterium]